MHPNRRAFLKTASTAAAATMLPASLLAQRPRSSNDRINLALIGAGIQGQGDTRTAITVPGVKLVAVADCYQGRLDHAKELWGQDLFTTRDYREILARPDVDAILCATPDHWHKQVAIDAMRAGKDVYCEKPMIHDYADGPQMIEAAHSTGRILQIGSQRVSSVIYAKAKELLASGAIGQLNTVSAHWDRNSSLGAWNYAIPVDASPVTCDWPMFEGSAPKVPFNTDRFFRWRKYHDYGSGVAGDLFVHLFSGTHFITGSLGPTRAMSTGGIRFWKDGRDVPDVLFSLFDYPENFNLYLRVNFVDGGEESSGFTFTGSEGTIEITNNGVILTRVPRESEPGTNPGTFAAATAQATLDAYHKQYPPHRPASTVGLRTETFLAPAGYSDSFDHFSNFFASCRTRKPPVEDATFGYRAAGAALLSNLSYEQDKIVHWDPKAMKLV